MNRKERRASLQKEWQQKQAMGTLFADDEYLLERDDLVGTLDHYRRLVELPRIEVRH